LTALRLGKAAAAERQLRAIQAKAPGDVNSLRLLGVALLDQDKTAAAIETLERSVSLAPNFWDARTDLARAYRQEGRLDAARAELRRVLKEAPALAAAWLAYGDVLVDQEKYVDAKFAFEQAQRFDPQRARIEQASVSLAAKDHQSAEKIFREILQADASHVSALCGLAAISLGASNTQDSERLLRHALKQAAHAPVARRGLSHTLLAAGRLAEAERATLELLKFEPENPQNWVALGTVYTRLLRQRDALAAFEEASRLKPTLVALRHSIGHLYKTLGQRAECEKAYHECLAMDPGFGDAYWSLADLKTYSFSDSEIAAMRKLLADGSGEGQAQLHFALGRAHEQRSDYSGAFYHYAAGNALRRKTSPFNIGSFEAKSRRVMTSFNGRFIRESEGLGCKDGSPIFIVGLPRSGSTLVEQILASHSSVEATMELPNILAMVREFDHLDGQSDAYPESVPATGRERLASLGIRYLDETRQIRDGRSRFIDKMPNNFSHVGLIHAILPNATLIDVRRHPMDACFSTFKQHFAEGQSFSYDLDDLGRYYRCYLSLMDHWDAVLPGKVLHLQYEELVRDPETLIRRLLEHCGLPFEAACMSFHESKRPVRTASSEQVRQPLYASGIGHWKHFANELEPLTRSLGKVLLERFMSVG
jgi:tetratricopeptide (TPR) repeat protein